MQQTNSLKKILISIALCAGAAGLLAAFTLPPKPRPNTKAVVFDIGGVLFDVNQKKVASKHMGTMNLIKYIFSGNWPTKLHEKACALLCKLRNEEPCDYKPDWPMAKGRPMPLIFIEWQKGEKTYPQIWAEIEAFVAKSPDFFETKTERKLVLSVLELMFNAEKRYEFTEPIKIGHALIKMYKKAGYEVYILSNMDHPSMALLKQGYPELFKLVDGIVYSAEAKVLKPYPAIYEKLCSDHGLCPEQCCFLDDQEENITAAQKLGFKTIHCTQQNMKRVFKKLVALAKAEKPLVVEA
jgi:HAD superfamily hydrolase (TIGR01509 family)